MASSDDLVRGYARALYAAAEAEGALGAVEDELFVFAKAVERNGQLREALTDPSLPAENRTAVIRDLLGERAHPMTGHLLGFVIESGRARDLGRIVDEFVAFAARERSHQVAEVRSAVPLTDQQRARIAEALSKATGRAIDVKVIVDPSVVGGVVARVGDEIFDGSVASRLDEAKQQLGG